MRSGRGNGRRGMEKQSHGDHRDVVAVRVLGFDGVKNARHTIRHLIQSCETRKRLTELKQRMGEVDQKRDRHGGRWGCCCFWGWTIGGPRGVVEEELTVKQAGWTMINEGMDRSLTVEGLCTCRAWVSEHDTALTGGLGLHSSLRAFVVPSAAAAPSGVR